MRLQLDRLQTMGVAEPYCCNYYCYNYEPQGEKGEELNAGKTQEERETGLPVYAQTSLVELDSQRGALDTSGARLRD